MFQEKRRADREPLARHVQGHLVPRKRRGGFGGRCCLPLDAALARVAALRLRVRVLVGSGVPRAVGGAAAVVGGRRGTTRGGSCWQSGHCFSVEYLWWNSVPRGRI